LTPCAPTASAAAGPPAFTARSVSRFQIVLRVSTLTPPADVHTALEKDIADFLGCEAAILYSQAFSTICSVIPAFAKRGDIIIADRGVNFGIQQGINISRCTVRWYEHNDLQSLEDVLVAVDKERKKKKWPLTRRFIITEGIFEKDGQMVDLPKLVSGVAWVESAVY
jgi:serine palmitoyltransferase